MNWRIKPLADLFAAAEEKPLKRSLGAFQLIMLGVGTVIGTGIFVLSAEAAQKAGPGMMIAFVLAASTCAFTALCYAELASMVPLSGSAYTYSYVVLGELIAWMVGWALILEYAVAASAVSVGWSNYFIGLLERTFSIDVPDALTRGPAVGGVLNLPAAAIGLLMTGLLVIGTRESATVNAVLATIKVAALVLFVALTLPVMQSGNFEPFAPTGMFGDTSGMGIAGAAASIFFAYIGFDAVSTSGEEADNPQRDLPIAIIGSLLIATLLYILVAIVAVGLAPQDQLAGSEAPLSDAIKIGAGLDWAGDLLSFGALVAITSVTLTILYGQTRIFFAMSRDGLLPDIFARLSARRTPWVTTLMFGILTAMIAALLPLTEIAKLVNIGTLFAFLIVNIGVIILRRTQPDLERGFRVPFVPVFPIIGSLLCIYLMSRLEFETWARFVGWLVLGLVIYFVYGRTHSRLQRGEGADEGRADALA
jgi:basic amino acid/polyamine antiporter, APA family